MEEYISPIEELIEDMRNGKMIVLADADDRENEGDLVIPAQMATPEAINFMAQNGRGLICLALNEERANLLGLKPMSTHNQSRHQTAFTISIEAREGISTGISAHDRAHTIATAIASSKDGDDIVSPGHVFPLVAKKGGVLVRAGHTEAAMDLPRLAGLYPAGVICEIMNDDGTMARLPDLVKFAQTHQLKLGVISDLIAYRRRHDTLIERVVETEIKLKNGVEFKAIVFKNMVENEEHIAFVKGDLSGKDAVLVRVHSENILLDVLAYSQGKDRGVDRALNFIAQEERGVVVVIRNTSSTPFSDYMDTGEYTEKSSSKLREYGVGAQILADLGLTKIELLSDVPKEITGLDDAYGLEIVGQRAFF